MPEDFLILFARILGIAGVMLLAASALLSEYSSLRAPRNS
jgi:hypothetical protein